MSTIIGNDSISLCQNIKQFKTDLQQETKYLDSLLRDLCQYYNTVRTKHQLNLEVPAGFRKSTCHQQMFKEFTPTQKTYQLIQDASSPTIDDTPLNADSHDLVVDDSSSIYNIGSDIPTNHFISYKHSSSTVIHIPIVRVVNQ